LTANSPVQTSRVPLFIVILLVLGLGGYASWLNHQFYLRQVPFFDSAAYTNYLARVMGAAQLDSFKDGLSVALDATTAPLPGLEALLLAVLHIPVSSPRQLGVWLQVIWLLALAVSLYLYWMQDRRRGTWASILLTLPFLFFAGAFNFNGGLPDFRLDLSLYILIASASVWYLRTYVPPGANHSRVPWLLAGFFLTLASLSRATAPVYWTVIAGPLLVVRFAISPREERTRLVQGVAWMILPSALVALPYFLTHFSYLYYYYAQWNQDANAHLSLEASLAHARFAFQHLGWALAGTGIFFFAAVLWDNRTSLRVSVLDWKLLYMGSAPVLFLILRGAGLNPFVSMPAVFGWLMFLIAPIKGNGPVLRSLWSRSAALLLLGACVWNAAQAPGQVGYPETRMSTMRQGIDWMREDSLRKKLPQVDFVSFHNWNYHPSFIRNVLIDEYGYRASRTVLLSPEGIQWMPSRVWKHQEGTFEGLVTASVELVWQEEVPGVTDDEKIDWMVGTAGKDIDYVFLPDDRTIDFMEKYISFNFINTKVRTIKKRLLETGEWEKIGTPLAITDFECVQLYTKRR
jgi:hypothetical protein